MLRGAKRWFLSLLLASLYLAVAAGSAGAEEQARRIEMLLPGEGKVGEELTVRALLSGEDVAPVAQAEVVFYSLGEFANVRGEIELGQAVTDENGVASLTYIPTSQGEQTIIALYQTAKASATILVRPGPPVYLQEEAGVKVPGVGVWLLASFVGAVWGIFLIIVVLLGFVAQDRPATSSHQIGRSYHQ